MNAIEEALGIIKSERDAKKSALDKLTQQQRELSDDVAGLDTAIAALAKIETSAVTAVLLPERPTTKTVSEIVQGFHDRPAAAPAQAITESAATPAENSPPGAVFTASALGVADALANEMLSDLPRLMTEFPHGPSIRDLMDEYGVPDSRARDACRRLHNSNRALLAANVETGLLHLTPRKQKAAA